MAISFLDLAAEVLATASTPLTYQQIWQTAVQSGLTTKVRTAGKTPWDSLGSRLYVDVRDNEQSRFIKIGKRPARFFMKARERELAPDIANTLDKEETKKPETKRGYRERDLHPLLTYFAYANPGFNRGRSVYTKTIYHEKSNKPGYNEWVHPDVVGFYLPLDDWHPDVVALNRLSDGNSLRLFSFELKRSLTKATYRESFFQAVSNSSWCTEGYLVTAEVLQDDDLLSELTRLTSSFGIGIIQIDPNDPDGWEILYPARTRPTLDWETINKLCDQNPDFKKFLQDVKIDFESKRVHKAEYDEIIKDIDGYLAKLEFH